MQFQDHNFTLLDNPESGKKKFNAISQSRTVKVFLVYLFLTFVYLPQIYFGSLLPDNKNSIFPSIVPYAVGHFLWFLITLIVFRISKQYPVSDSLKLKRLGIHFLFAVLFSTIFTLIYYLILGLVEGVGSGHLVRIVGNSFLLAKYITHSFLFYSGILACVTALDYSKFFRDREFRLQQAEFANLKSQLHPHFLFNTLNAIATLIYISPAEATKMISQLSDLLRTVLQGNNSSEVTLREELNFLEKYLQIHQSLLQERLEIYWKIETETLNALVPSMVLQPFVENSIRHGITPKEEGGKIEISARHNGGNLFIEVKDSGLGAEAKKNSGNKISLKNITARLKHLYGDDYRFESRAQSNGDGWFVGMTIPFRERT